MMKSRYKGITYSTRDKKWVARITHDGKEQSVGRFNSEEEALKMYDKMAVRIGAKPYKLKPIEIEKKS